MDDYKLKEDKQDFKFALMLIAIVGAVFSLAAGGIMLRIDHALAQYGMALAGYQDKIYVTQSRGAEAIPIMGAGYLEQPIYMNERMCASPRLMLGFKMAAYLRKNTGSLYVKLSQEDKEDIFEIDMALVKDNEEIRLIFETEKWTEGYLSVELYSPESSGENCVGLYAVSNTDIYDPLCINGEMMEKNAVINVYLPSRFADSDFKYTGEGNKDEADYSDTMLQRSGNIGNRIK